MTAHSNLFQAHLIDGPTDPEERIFWLIEKVNRYRHCRYEEDFWHPCLKELVALCEKTYSEWLRPRVHKSEIDQHTFLVLPYVSFRFLNARPSKAVQLVPVSSVQRQRFFEVFGEEMFRDMPESKIFIAMTHEYLKPLLEFFESLYRRRIQ